MGAHIKNQYISPSNTVYDCSIVKLPKIENRSGNITPIHSWVNIPFQIKRIFYSYDIPGGESRGAHAHKKCHQFLIAASGSFEVVLDDGISKRTVLLNRPFYGLHIPPGIWASEQGFSSGSVCLVLASHIYEEDDYLRDYQGFLNYKSQGIFEMCINVNGGGVNPKIFYLPFLFTKSKEEVA